MKKILLVISATFLLAIWPGQQSHAVVWVVVKAALKKAIKAMDLAIQQQQNKVLVLQNAQKALENTLSKIKLDEITGWVEKQKNLYQQYFDELQQIKTMVAYWHSVKELVKTQQNILAAYQHAWGLFQQDVHFSPDELHYMGKVYEGMLAESADNLDRLSTVVQAFTVRMTDAQRLTVIQTAAAAVHKVYDDLVQFNEQAVWLSLQRAKDLQDIASIRTLYGIPSIK